MTYDSDVGTMFVSRLVVFAGAAVMAVFARADIELSSESVELAKDDTKRILQVALKGEGLWTASTDADWITLMRTSGTETTVPFYRISHNYSTDVRRGVIAVNGLSYTVIQKGYNATLDLDRVTVPAIEMANAASVEFDVETAVDGTLIAWTAKSDQEWVTVTPESGTADAEGHGSVFYRVASNEEPTERIATLTIAGRTFTVVQESAGGSGGGEDERQVSLSPSELTLACAGTEKTVEVIANSNVSWTVVSGADWVKPNITSGRGSSPLGLAVAQNLSVLSRRCEVQVGDNVLTIIQKGTTDYQISTAPPTSVFPYNGETKQIDVDANEDLEWTATSQDPWITFPPSGATEMNLSGEQTLRLQTSLNSGLAVRTGTVEIAAHIPYPEVDIMRGLTLWRGANQNVGCAYDDVSIRDPEVKGETEGVWFVLNDPEHMNSLHRLFDLNGGSASLYVTTENRLVFDASNGEIVDLKFPVEVNVKYDLFFVSSETATLIYGGVHDAGAYRLLYTSDSVLEITAYGHTTKPSEDNLKWGSVPTGAYYYWTRPLNATEMVNMPQEMPSVSRPLEACYETLYNSFAFDGFRVWSRDKSSEGHIFRDEGMQYTSDRFGLCQNAMKGSIAYNQILRVGSDSMPRGYPYDDIYWSWWDTPPYRYYDFVGSLKEMRKNWDFLVEGDQIYKSGYVSVNMWVNFKSVTLQRFDLFEILRVNDYIRRLDGKDFEGEIAPQDKCKVQFSERGLTLVENGVLSPDFGADYVKKDEWIMLTLASNGSILTLYVNGVDVGNVALSGYKNFCPDCWSCYGEGHVVFDDVKTFTSCLSTEQIVQMYNLEKPLKAIHAVVQEAAIPSLAESEMQCPSSSGEYSVSLTLPNRIRWTAESNESWIHVSTNGAGAATISFTVDKNVETHERVGTITIAGLTYTIRQGGTGVFLPETVFIAAFDGSEMLEIPVEADDEDTHWTVDIVQNLQGDPLFLDFEGFGSGTLCVFVGECRQEAFSQIGIIEISGRRAYIVQRDFELWISPASTNFTWRGGAGTIDVVTEDRDFDIWQAVSDSDWITITEGKTRSGDGQLFFTVDENTTGKDRTGRIIVSGEVCEIVQMAPGVPTELEIVGSDSVLAGAKASYQAFLVYSDGDRRSMNVEWVLPSSGLAQMADDGTLSAGSSAGVVTINALCEVDGKSWHSAKEVQIVSRPILLAIEVGKTTVCVNDKITLGFVVTYADGTSDAVVPESVVVVSGDASITDGSILAIGPQMGSVSLSATYTLSGITVSANKVIVVRDAISCEEALGSDAFEISNVSVTPWAVDTEMSHDGQFACVSEGADTASDLKFSVAGAGNFSCWMKSTAQDSAVAVGQVWVDGALVATLYGNTDWTNVIKRIETFGSHEIIVSRLSDSADSKALWVDEVTWDPIAPELTSLSIAGTSRLVDGRTASLTCNATYTDGNVKIVVPTWLIASGKTYATIDSTGILTAKKTGKVVVSATYTDADVTKTATLSITIVKGLSSVEITGPTSVYAGDSAVYSCLARYTDGSAEVVNADWALISESGCAMLNLVGGLTALDSNGTALIKASFTYEGETKTATYSVGVSRQILVDADVTGGSAAFVPVSWANQYPTFRTLYGNDLAAAMAMLTGKKDGAGKRLNVWQDYVAGTDPTDVNDVFQAIIEFEDGLPKVGWRPNLNGKGEVRTYKIYGRRSLSDGDAWESPANSAEHQFFKVEVSMPGAGDGGSDAPGVIEAWHLIAMPTAENGLVYDGTVKQGVLPSAGYTLTDASAIDANEYLARVVLVDGYKWTTGETRPIQIPWQIAKAKNDWVNEPGLSREEFVVGSPGEISFGESKFGVVRANYSEADLLNLPAGSYSLKFTVDGTENYSGLSKTVNFAVRRSPATDIGLLHRWSFDGDLIDSVGGVKAVAPASVGLSNGVATVSSETYVDLGKNLIPADGRPFTLEVWATQAGERAKNERVFSLSTNMLSAVSECFNWLWDNEYNRYQRKVSAWNEAYVGEGRIVGATHHFAVVGEPKDNAYSLTFYLDGKVEWTSSSDSSWKTAPMLRLGFCVNGNFDEVRIWAKAFSGAEVAASCDEGPNENLFKADIPVANEGLVYNGQSQIGVSDGVGYTLTGERAVDAGEHTAIATLKDGYAWSDGVSSQSRAITWFIAKAKNSWLTNPSLSSTEFEEGSAVTINMGAVRFGVRQANYTAAELAGLSAGSYTLVVSVPEADNYTGLAKSIPFTVTETSKEVSGISISPASLILNDIGETSQLAATVLPATALNKAVTWSTSNPSVVTVMDGLITSVGLGGATVTATTQEGRFSKNCSVTVANVCVADGEDPDVSNVKLYSGSHNPHSGNGSWCEQSGQVYAGGMALRSDNRVNRSSDTYVGTIVYGVGTISFAWKMSSSKYGRVRFMKELDVKAEINGPGGEWQHVSLRLDGQGCHRIRWVYENYDSIASIADSGSDCCWVDNICWTPDQSTANPPTHIEVNGNDSITPRTYNKTYTGTLYFQSGSQSSMSSYNQVQFGTCAILPIWSIDETNTGVTINPYSGELTLNGYTGMVTVRATYTANGVTVTGTKVVEIAP